MVLWTWGTLMLSSLLLPTYMRAPISLYVLHILLCFASVTDPVILAVARKQRIGDAQPEGVSDDRRGKCSGLAHHAKGSASFWWEEVSYRCEVR